jgi:CRP-like cAMP-binding protein
MSPPTQSFKNRLLALCDPREFDQIRAHLEPVALEYKLALYEPYRPIDWVYFPTAGVVSLVNTMANGAAAEVGTIGNEGMVGVPIVFGDRMAPTSAYVQVPGAGLRLRASILRDCLERSAGVRGVMLHYAHAFFNQVAQSAACNTFHSVDQRCCRWLLMTHDRVQSDEFLLTHEFLGMMLGVQRSSVSLAAAKLKKRKLIRYNRGQVTILDRAGLEKTSCECYATAKREFDRLLGDPLGARKSQSASGARSGVEASPVPWR